jgi:site-specific recombinase XerD
MNTAAAIFTFIDDRHYRQLSPRTIDAYKWALYYLDAYIPTLPTNRADIRKLIADQLHLNPVSKLNLWIRLRVFFSWTTEEWGHPNPFHRLPRPKIPNQYPRTLRATDIAALMDAALTRRDRALVAVALDTGVRLAELTSMLWEGVTHQTIQVTGKNGQRTVPTTAGVRQLLVGLGDARHVWTGRKGPLTTSGVQAAIRKTMYRAGFHPPRNGPHTLRHTFGTEFIRRGGNPYTLQQILGHTTISTTMLYVHMARVDLIEQHAKYSPMANLDLLTRQLPLEKQA